MYFEKFSPDAFIVKSLDERTEYIEGLGCLHSDFMEWWESSLYDIESFLIELNAVADSLPESDNQRITKEDLYFFINPEFPTILIYRDLVDRLNRWMSVFMLYLTWSYLPID